MTRVLFDVDVVLDVLANRLPFAEHSSKALALAEAGVITGLIAAHTVTTLHYLLRRDLGSSRTKTILGDLLRVVDVAPVDDERIRLALAMGWRDFEDAVQAACAEKAECDFLVTRNKNDFKKATTPVVEPAELLALIA